MHVASRVMLMHSLCHKAILQHTTIITPFPVLHISQGEGFLSHGKRVTEVPNQGQKAGVHIPYRSREPMAMVWPWDTNPRPEERGDGQAPSTFLLLPFGLSFLVI